MYRLLTAICLLVGATALRLPAGSAPAQGGPTNDPLAPCGLPWTKDVRWANVVSIAQVPGPSLEARFEAAQAQLAAKGGGVVYFPAGTYAFREDLRIRDGIVIRGADPKGITDARKEGYDLPTRFEFPRYVPKLEGEGTPISTAFKGILLAHPESDSNCGVANVAINRGHIHLLSGAENKKGRNRFVYGCILRNAALADPKIPDTTKGQHPWQRFTLWHGGAAIEAYTEENLLIANNRLPASGEDNFLMPGYVLLGRDRKPTAIEEGVLFDYDNRGGIVANDYAIGGGGGALPIGTPDLFPYAFTRGIVIRDNYIFCTGRSAIQFCGDGVVCSHNVIRFRPGVVRYTNTGLNITSGSSTNDNRAVQMRGWRWTLEDNDYEVYKNLSADKHYYINDGEGLMHEGHCNSAVVDSKLIGNRGNAYLSIFHTGGINGLLIRGNTIRTDKGTSDGIAAIYVMSSRHGQDYPCENVHVLDNVTSGSGIQIGGGPGKGNRVAGNRHEGPNGKIIVGTAVDVTGNTGYTEVKK